MRGKIMRDTNAGTGIVFVNGEQKNFTLESNWKSGTPPKVGSIVDIVLDDNENVVALTVVDEAILAKEQAKKALNFASKNSKQYWNTALNRIGAPTLIAIGALTISWLFLSTITVEISKMSIESFSFYEILKLINSGASLEFLSGSKNTGAEIWGLLMLIVVLSPIAPHFHDNKYLRLAYCVPLLFWLSVGFSLYSSLKGTISQARGLSQSFLGGRSSAQSTDQLMDQMISLALKAVSLGAGFYLSVVILTYLTIVGVKKYLASTSSN